MRSAFFPLCLTMFAMLGIWLAGCGGDSSSEATGNVARSGAPPAAEAGHDEHADHDEHEHPTEGPHGGHLIELGNEEYHAELLHDESSHTVTIHLLDKTGKEPVAIAQTEIALQLFQDGQYVKYTLKAVAGPGNPSGTAAQFQLVDATLCDALCNEEGLRGRLQVTIDGKPYTGTIEHSGHADHDHEGHDHEGHKH